jgi:hypothetical protein
MQEHCSFLAGSPKLLSLEMCWECLWHRKNPQFITFGLCSYWMGLRKEF